MKTFVLVLGANNRAIGMLVPRWPYPLYETAQMYLILYLNFQTGEATVNDTSLYDVLFILKWHLV